MSSGEFVVAVSFPNSVEVREGSLIGCLDFAEQAARPKQAFGVLGGTNVVSQGSIICRRSLPAERFEL